MTPRKRIVDRLHQAKTILAVTHARPDGDGLGAIAALAGSAAAAGKLAFMLAPDRVPQRYEFLFGGVPVAGAEQFADLADQSDVVAIVDTCSFGQLDGLEPALRTMRDKIVVVDHHRTADLIGSLQWVDESAAAAGVMTAELLADLAWPMPTGEVGIDVPRALATAIVSDTGWLRFANTDSRALRAMERLLDAGVRCDKLYAILYQCDRPQRLALMARMLSSLELFCDGQLAVMSIRKVDFQASGALPEETENMVNEALRIGTVESAVLLTESGDLIRASLRSRERIDVSAVAQSFGGGGHARASGVRSALGLDEFKRQLVAAFDVAFKKV